MKLIFFFCCTKWTIQLCFVRTEFISMAIIWETPSLNLMSAFLRDLTKHILFRTLRLDLGLKDYQTSCVDYYMFQYANALCSNQLSIFFICLTNNFSFPSSSHIHTMPNPYVQSKSRTSHTQL